MSESAPPVLGVALSGGGVRASLFSLGALLYLVDTGLNRRVREISSVSGGSITSGFVAQRCDFSDVDRDAFDRVASDLAGAIVAGLLPTRLLLALYGLLGGMVLAVVAWLRPLTPARLLVDILMVVGFGAVLLFRGAILERWLRRRLFAPAGRAATLGSIRSAVAHVFCATDLNSSMPIYLTSRRPYILSPGWGRPSANLSAMTIAEAVRASAAFPGAFSPKRLDAGEGELELTPMQTLQRLRMLAFRDVTSPPRVLYLADGGIWNNLGTDWFDPDTRRSCALLTDEPGGIQQLLIVDASAPTAARRRMPSLRIPWIAEVALLYRVLLVTYASTVTTRLSALTRDGDQSGAAVSSTSRVHSAAAVAGLGLPLQDRLAGKIAWLGDPDRWTGQPPAWRRSTTWVVRRAASLDLWDAKVATTLSAMPAEVAVQLMIHGYLATADALSKRSVCPPRDFPGVGRFAKLVGLDATWYAPGRLSVLGRRGTWEERQDELREACVGEVAGIDLKRACDGITAAVTSLETWEDDRRAFEARCAEEDAQVEYDRDFTAFTIEARRARASSVGGDFQQARERFDKAFALIPPSDDRIAPDLVAAYAHVLTALGDPRAAPMAREAERKAAARVAGGPRPRSESSRQPPSRP